MGFFKISEMNEQTSYKQAQITAFENRYSHGVRVKTQQVRMLWRKVSLFVVVES